MDRRTFISIPLAGAALPAHALSPARGKVALVLGGGGCRGYGHVGVLRVLQREGLKPDLVVGSSSGAIVGALYASGVPASRMSALGERLSGDLLRDWIFRGMGVFRGSGIAEFVRSQVGARAVESLSPRFAAVATDLRNGRNVVLDRGDLALAVQASASVPGLLEPVESGERLLVDGNLTSPVPVRAARSLGATRVVAVDVTFPPARAQIDGPIDALYQGFSILTRRLALEERARADLVIEPPIPECFGMSERVVREHVAAGESAARRALPVLRSLMRSA
jgi:NTE family protein